MKVAVVTATRAEYGILKPLIEKLQNDPDIELQLLVTGTHLSDKYGNTQHEIENDGLQIFQCIPILADGNTAKDVTKTMANALERFAEYFEDEKPVCIIVLGDRTEILGICAAALTTGIPIVHIHGGELTEGAVDDCVRHAITKMSYLHFATTEVYRRRIIQMGEAPERVFNVGALGVENILHTTLIDEVKIREELEVPVDKELVSVTFHPVTMESGSEKEQISNLIEAMKEKNQYYYVITKANADVGGATVNNMLEEYCGTTSNSTIIASLGMRRYLSLVKCSRFVLGNSSSGVIEAPSLGTPTVNIGTRQKGRIMAESVICCEPEKESILSAINKVEQMKHKASFLFGDGNTSDKILNQIKATFSRGESVKKKKFYDILFDI